MKVRFNELTEQEYYDKIRRSELQDEVLYFVSDRGALYKGRMLIADNTENSEFIHWLLSQDPGGLLFALNEILERLGLKERLVYGEREGFHLE